MLGVAGLIVVLLTVGPVWAQDGEDGGNEPGYCGASCEPALEIAEDPNLIFSRQEFFVPPTYSAAAALEEPAVLEEPPVLSEDPLGTERATEPIVVESSAVSESDTAEDAVPAPPISEQTDEQAESAPAESEPSKALERGLVGSSPEAYDPHKVERRVLGLLILVWTFIVAAFIVWRKLLPMRGNVEASEGAAAASAHDQERLGHEGLNGVRHLGRISQRRFPSS